MGIKFGDMDVASIKYCDRNGAVEDVSEVVRNGVKIWLPKRYLTFTSEQADSTVTFNYLAGTDAQYRVNGGEWTACPSGTTVILPDRGTVQYKGTNIKTDTSHHFTMSGLLSGSGDVTSLTNGIGGDVELVEDSIYSYMFCGCSSMTASPNLPSTSLSPMCYLYMFSGCSSISKAPLLPATTLVNQCYGYMFHDCSAITAATIMATATGTNSCMGMFFSCSRLNTLTTRMPSFSGCFRWLGGVSSTGAIHCTQTLKNVIDIARRGISTIPDGWSTIVDQV